MGAVEEDFLTLEPEASPRWIGDEEIPWEPDESKINDAISQLQVLEPANAFLSQDGWGYIHSTLKAEIERLMHQLVYAPSGEDATLIRGKIQAYEWVQSLPRVVRQAVDANRAAIDQEEKGPDPIEQEGAGDG